MIRVRLLTLTNLNFPPHWVSGTASKHRILPHCQPGKNLIHVLKVKTQMLFAYELASWQVAGRWRIIDYWMLTSNSAARVARHWKVAGCGWSLGERNSIQVRRILPAAIGLLIMHYVLETLRSLCILNVLESRTSFYRELMCMYTPLKKFCPPIKL